MSDLPPELDLRRLLTETLIPDDVTVAVANRAFERGPAAREFLRSHPGATLRVETRDRRGDPLPRGTTMGEFRALAAAGRASLHLVIDRGGGRGSPQPEPELTA